MTYWSFRGEEAPTKPQKLGKQESLQPHTSPISCLDISRDGAMAVTGGVDSLVNLWQLNTHELMSTLEGHIASVTCITFSASGLFVASGKFILHGSFIFTIYAFINEQEKFRCCRFGG